MTNMSMFTEMEKQMRSLYSMTTLSSKKCIPFLNLESIITAKSSTQPLPWNSIPQFLYTISCSTFSHAIDI